MIPFLIPFKQVGMFVLESDIGKYISGFDFEVNDYSLDKFEPSIHYTIYNPELTLFVIAGIIQYIGCYEELLYKGTNLIGISIDELISIVAVEYTSVDKHEFEEDGIPQFVYEFEDAGLQVWEKGYNRKIVSILVNGKDHYRE